MKPILWISFLLLISRCQQPQEAMIEVELPSTPIFTNETNWGVLSDPYAALLEEKDKPESVLATCRKGDILEVFEIYREKEGAPLWILVKFQDKKGWIQRDAVALFDNLEQAETASRQIIQEP